MRIVLVSPSRAERSALEQLLADDGHEVIAIATHTEGIDVASRLHPDVFIADVRVADESRALIRALSAQELRPRLILLCPRARCGATPNAVTCLTKPIDLEQLRRCIVTPQRRVA